MLGCVFGKTLPVAGHCEVADSTEHFSKALLRSAASRPALPRICAACRTLSQTQFKMQRFAAPLMVAVAPLGPAAQKLVRTLIVE